MRVSAISASGNAGTGSVVRNGGAEAGTAIRFNIRNGRITGQDSGRARARRGRRRR